jgi:glycosyltransferase involved in cell wall biosynthesis
LTAPSPTILFPLQLPRSFIEADLMTLRRVYRVEALPCQTTTEVLAVSRAVKRADLLCCWFGSLRFLPAIRQASRKGVPVLVICGGYDVASVPTIGYGTMRLPITRWFGRKLFALADAVAPFSASAAAEVRENVGVDPNRVHVIPLGFDSPEVRQYPPRETLVVTVANIDSSTLERKGLRTVARISRILPHVRFMVAGGGDPAAMARLRADAGANLTLLGRLSDPELRDLFARATVYLQPSVHEGFGSAVAEAMLHGCIPVVSNVYSLPEVVGSCGLYADPWDVPAFAELIERVLAGGFVPPIPPREFVLTHFPAGRRERALLGLVAELLDR